VETCRLGYVNLVGKLETPSLPADKFIEVYLPQVLGTEVFLDPYADLRKEGREVILGATYFFDDYLEVKIDRRVTEEADRTDQWGRYNATAVHEGGGHCILHPVLFQRDPNQQMLFHSPVNKKISCLQRTIEGFYTSEWWEYQANQFMANLLMPKGLFLAHFEMERNAYGIRDNRELAENQHVFNAVVGYLARTFQVSKQAVKIRLAELKQIPNLQQEEFFRDSGFVSIGDVFMGRFVDDFRTSLTDSEEPAPDSSSLPVSVQP